VKLVKIAPWGVAGLCVLLCVAAMLPPRKVKGYDLEAFGRLPVLEGGRVKPLDTVARNALLMIRSQQSFRTEKEGEAETVSASRWLLSRTYQRLSQRRRLPSWKPPEPGANHDERCRATS
jgi:hypothetical protein